MPDIELTETERNVLARYFGMGPGSEIISHPPHATIGLHRHAFERLLKIGLLIETPFNDFGVKRIRCTEEAAKIAWERMQENCAELYQVIGTMADHCPDPCAPAIVKALDNASAAANGDPRPHDDLLPFVLPAPPERPRRQPESAP